MSLVIVHGGVSGLEKEPSRHLPEAVAAGSRREHALDMVEAATRVMEDDPALNAGYGAVLDAEGHVSLDAGIADGTRGSFGAVAAVTVANPVALARRVLDRTPHSLMTGPGAMALGTDLPEVAIAPDRRVQWETARARGRLGGAFYGHPDAVDTVGTVALDQAGNLAAACSTGGVFGKLPGRVGDSPIFGAGFYASTTAAVVGTGVGELMLETLACARTATLIERGSSAQEACEEVVAYIGVRSPVPVGLLALDASGDHGCAFRGGSLPVVGPAGRLSPVEVT